MRLPIKMPLLSLVLAATTLSCADSSNDKEKSEVKSVIDGNVALKPTGLGVGFDSDTQTLKSTCVTGSQTFVGGGTAKIRYEQDISYDQVIDSISGGANIGAKINIFNVTGAADFASKESSDEFSSTIALISTATIKSNALNDESLKLTALGASQVVDGAVSPNVRKVCGDEFVSQIDYAAKLFINAKIRFASAQDKLEFKGSANVSLAGIGELGGQIAKLSDKIKKNSSVTITAEQTGGRVQDLGKILDESVITCNLSEFETKCLPILQAFVKYAKEDFRTGFDLDAAAIKPFEDDVVAKTEVAKADALAADAAKANDPTSSAAKEASDKAATSAALVAKAQQTLQSEIMNRNYAQVLYTTSKYSDKAIMHHDQVVSLAPDVADSILTSEMEIARDETYDEYQIQLADYYRSTDLLRDFTLDAKQRAKIKAVQTATSANRKTIAAVGNTCLKSPLKCEEALEKYKTNVKTYDARDLSTSVCMIPSDVAGSSWAFGPKEGNYYGNLTLGADGLVEGYRTDAEFKWEVKDCILRFINSAGFPSTVFDTMANFDHLEGNFLQFSGQAHRMDRIK